MVRKRTACCCPAWWPVGRRRLAGLQGGDVIVELAGLTIANIYDYTYALDLLKVDEPASVVYMRDGDRMEAELTPEAR